eukprot:GHVN01028362.1.p1 GENE.GHVN01028362.1~~GHVN01028362.1.p1  ORF type:complete len:252 (-),score=67.31 GHVN01028362.1:104-859(-)
MVGRGRPPSRAGRPGRGKGRGVRNEIDQAVTSESGASEDTASEVSSVDEDGTLGFAGLTEVGEVGEMSEVSEVREAKRGGRPKGRAKGRGRGRAKLIRKEERPDESGEVNADVSETREGAEKRRRNKTEMTKEHHQDNLMLDDPLAVLDECRYYPNKHDVAHLFEKGEIVYALWSDNNLYKAMVHHKSAARSTRGWQAVYFVSYQRWSFEKYSEWKRQSLMCSLNAQTTAAYKLLSKRMKKHKTDTLVKPV